MIVSNLRVKGSQTRSSVRAGSNSITTVRQKPSSEGFMIPVTPSSGDADDDVWTKSYRSSPLRRAAAQSGNRVRSSHINQRLYYGHRYVAPAQDVPGPRRRPI
ncbi:hypothetical protein EVAR_30793_1 [Eumeta japonica]|uniref:Uncharacterized protein n=1 Tax=Eumeta variegata TaxID=151549 RepID=A0A4C1V6I0_EUMVA|nr:hypothetical protein EVAR_30793_1 [Eumeta japonica]